MLDLTSSRVNLNLRYLRSVSATPATGDERPLRLGATPPSTVARAMSHKGQ